MFDMDMDYFSDGTAWGVGGAMYLIFMAIIWLTPDLFGGAWEGMMFERILISALALPLLYVIAKWRLGN